MRATRILTGIAVAAAAGLASLAFPAAADAATICSPNIIVDSAHLPGFTYSVCGNRSGSYVSGRVQVRNQSKSASYYVSSYFVKSSVGNGGAVTCSGGWVAPGQSFYCDSLQMFDQFGGSDYASGEIGFWDPISATYLSASTGSPYV
jgi:hypothetical protein